MKRKHPASCGDARISALLDQPLVNRYVTAFWATHGLISFDVDLPLNMKSLNLSHHFT
jgi:hypothetical protein